MFYNLVISKSQCQVIPIQPYILKLHLRRVIAILFDIKIGKLLFEK